MVSVHASPVRFDQVASRMMQWVDHVLSPGYPKYSPAGTWTPAINVYEDPACFYVVADLAGLNTEQMDLRVEREFLVLSGRRDTPQPNELAGAVVVHLMEIDHDQFCRSIRLPPGADANAIEASYRNGYLWVRIPKTGSSPRSVAAEGRET